MNSNQIAKEFLESCLTPELKNKISDYCKRCLLLIEKVNSTGPKNETYQLRHEIMSAGSFRIEKKLLKAGLKKNRDYRDIFLVFKSDFTVWEEPDPDMQIRLIAVKHRMYDFPWDIELNYSSHFHGNDFSNYKYSSSRHIWEFNEEDLKALNSFDPKKLQKEISDAIDNAYKKFINILRL